MTYTDKERIAASTARGDAYADFAAARERAARRRDGERELAASQEWR